MAVTEVYKGDAVASNVVKLYLGDTVVFTREAPSVYDPLVQAYLDRCTALGYTPASGAELDALNTMIVQLRTDGVIALLDVLYVMAQNGDSDAATINLIDASSNQLTKVNSPTFTTNEGFTGNGTSSYLDTNWNPSTDGVNYTLNRASLGVYQRLNIVNNNGIDLGAVNVPSESQVATSYNATFTWFNKINSSGQNLGTSGSRFGFHFASRTSSSNQKTYINGVEVDSDSISSNNITNANVFLLARNFSGAKSFSQGQLAIAFAGADLSSKATEFNNAVADYMADLQVAKLSAQATIDGYTEPSDEVKGYLKTLISTLMKEGIFYSLDTLYVMATDGDSDYATYNVVDPSSNQLTKVNSPTFTSLEGFTGNGTSSYLDTNWNPSTDGVNYTLNSASLGVYARTNIAEVATYLAVRDSTNGTGGYINRASGSNFYELNTSIGSGFTTTSSRNETGLLIFNRDSATSVDFIINGATTFNVDSNSNGVPNRNLTLLALNNNGSIIGESSSQISIAFAGADLSAKATELYNAIQTYMTNIGSNV